MKLNEKLLQKHLAMVVLISYYFDATGLFFSYHWKICIIPSSEELKPASMPCNLTVKAAVLYHRNDTHGTGQKSLGERSQDSPPPLILALRLSAAFPVVGVCQWDCCCATQL